MNPLNKLFILLALYSAFLLFIAVYISEQLKGVQNEATENIKYINGYYMSIAMATLVSSVLLLVFSLWTDASSAKDDLFMNNFKFLLFLFLTILSVVALWLMTSNFTDELPDGVRQAIQWTLVAQVALLIGGTVSFLGVGKNKDGDRKRDAPQSSKRAFQLVEKD